jgi:hypothetical protein
MTEAVAQDDDLPVEAVHEATAYVRDHREREQICMVTSSTSGLTTPA